MRSQNSALEEKTCMQRIRQYFSCCYKESSHLVVESRVEFGESMIEANAAVEILRRKKEELLMRKEQILRNSQILRKEKWKVYEASAIYQDQSCSICLGQSANVRLQCRHYFHRGCLWQWNKTKLSCPNCRKIPKILSVICDSCKFQSFDQKINQAKREPLLDQFGLHIKHQCDTCVESLQKKQSKIFLPEIVEIKQKNITQRQNNKPIQMFI